MRRLKKCVVVVRVVGPVDGMCRVAVGWRLLGLLAAVVGAAVGSEFPERECCDLDYPPPQPPAGAEDADVDAVVTQQPNLSQAANTIIPPKGKRMKKKTHREKHETRAKFPPR